MNGAVEDLSKLSDSAVWMNRIEITSDSGSKYIISQRRSDGVWACSCPRWKFTKQTCKHLAALNLGGNKSAPVADVIEAIGRMRWNAQQIRAEAGVKAVPVESARTRPPRPAPRSKPAPKPTPLRMVDLVAVAFEWECFSCCHVNREEEVSAEVACANCSARFKVGKFRRSR